MPDSIASSHYGIAFLKLQSDSNLVSRRSLTAKPHLPSFPPNNSSIQFGIKCKFHPQPPLNQSTCVPLTHLISISRIPKIYRLSNNAPLRCGISSNGYSAKGGRSLRDWMELAGEALSTAFPLWVTLGCVLGLMKPSSFNWVMPKLSIIGLTIIMLGMGMTLTLDDLRGALAMPKEVLSGFVLQYSVSTYLLYSSVLGCPLLTNQNSPHCPN